VQRLQSIAEGVSRVGAVAGGLLLLVAAILICIDITLRYTIAVTLGGADELSGYALAIASAWGFSTALLHRSHIRIDTVYVRVRPRLRAVLDLASLAVLAGFIATVAWYAWGVVWQSFVSDSHSQSAIEAPLVVPQGLWFGGLAFFVAVAVLQLVGAGLAWLRGDLGALFQMIGSKSAVAEAEEEVQNVERAIAQEKQE